MKRYIRSAVKGWSEEDWWTQQEIAQNTSTSPQILSEMVSDRMLWCDLARNPNTPVEYLRKFANEDSAHLLDSLACNPNTPLDVLDAVARKGDWHTQQAVIANPNVSYATLERLATSRCSSAKTKQMAKEKLKSI